MATHTPHLTELGKTDGLIWADELQQLVFKYRMFRFPKSDVSVFTAWFSTASF
jgi:hypothetical protein